MRWTLDVPTQPGRPWLLGLALDARPGLPLRLVPGVGYERLPLAHDSLLAVSLSLPMGGLLSPMGTGTAALRIPGLPSLLSLELHSAAFTLDASLGIGAISNRQPVLVVR